MIPTVGVGCGMAHLMFLFVRVRARAVPAFFELPEVAVPERFLDRVWCVPGRAGETRGATARLRLPRR
ncbi:hypothetical protein D3C81_2159880 [compost metagenome]